MKSLNEEKRLIQILQGNKVFFEGELVEILFVGKPIYHSGEGKTDFYILLSNGKEIKVSSKSKTADFLENKINAPRAEQIFGKDWSKIISSSETDSAIFLIFRAYFAEHCLAGFLLFLVCGSRLVALPEENAGVVISVFFHIG